MVKMFWDINFMLMSPVGTIPMLLFSVIRWRLYPIFTIPLLFMASLVCAGANDVVGSAITQVRVKHSGVIDYSLPFRLVECIPLLWLEIFLLLFAFQKFTNGKRKKIDIAIYALAPVSIFYTLLFQLISTM